MSAGKTRAQPGPAQADYEILAEFRHLLRRFAAFSEDAARREGLPAQQHQALLAIKGFPQRDTLTVGELAERLGLHHNSVVGLVDRLVSRRLVRRIRGTADRRQVLIGLTAAGEAALLKLSLAHRRELRSLAPLLRLLLEQLQDAGTGTRALTARSKSSRRAL